MAIAAAPEPLANMGEPAPRVDARQKVTGEARYASDFPLANPAYAICDDTAIKVVDGAVEVISEGHWKLFTA